MSDCGCTAGVVRVRAVDEETAAKAQEVLERAVRGLGLVGVHASVRIERGDKTVPDGAER